MLDFDGIKIRLIYFCAVVILFSFIILGIKKDNHFYGLNESSNFLDCLFYSSITFSSSGFANIYPQTELGRMIILFLSVIKLLIIVWPLEKLDGDYFTIPKTNSRITIEDVDDVINQLADYDIK